ncbi:MAG: hypothetical protein IT478_03050 [Xanthomonadales bacterium]|nr:hypothetical protein [Xanthomonadales bacterium]
MEFIKTHKWFLRTTDFAQYLALLRQFNVVSRIIVAMQPAQRRQISLIALEELARAESGQAVPARIDASKWTADATQIFARTRSQHAFISGPAVQRWLICAYRATFNSPYGEVQSLHRAVLRALRHMQGEATVTSSDVRRDQRRYA